MFQVLWTREALDDLADLWLDAETDLRQQITAATNLIDRLLQAEPDAEGESRPDGRRILIEPPLGIIFRVNRRSQLVRILRVWTFPRRLR